MHIQINRLRESTDRYSFKSVKNFDTKELSIGWQARASNVNLILLSTRTEIEDVFARRIMGWRVSHSIRTDCVLDALEQALYVRQLERSDAEVHHSHSGSQYVSIHCTERLAEAEIEPSAGSRGDSYDNALAETISGLHKTEPIYKRAPWKSREAVALATLERGGLVHQTPVVGVNRRSGRG